jgi:hypothetical protein
VSTWERKVNGQNFARLDPDEPILLELTYVPSDGRIHLSIAHGATTVTSSQDFSPIIAGPAELGFTFGWNDGAGLPQVAQVELEEVVLEVPAGAMSPIEPKEQTPEEHELAAALRTFSLGDRGKSAPALVAVADRSPRADLRKKAAPLAALALAEAGEQEDAVGRLGHLLEVSPADLDPVFASVEALDVRSREALARAYLRRHGDLQGVLRRIPELEHQGRWGEAAIAYRATGARERGDVLREANAWARARDPETALKLVESLDAPQARFLAGQCAAALERLDLVLEKWRGFSDEELGPYFVPWRRRAERLLGRAGPR